MKVNGTAFFQDKVIKNNTGVRKWGDKMALPKSKVSINPTLGIYFK